jgi:hypothetical protein
MCAHFEGVLDPIRLREYFSASVAAEGVGGHALSPKVMLSVRCTAAIGPAPISPIQGPFLGVQLTSWPSTPGARTRTITSSIGELVLPTQC